MRCCGVIGLALLATAVTTCRELLKSPALYFGQAPPGDEPAVFAPGVISLEGRFEQFLLYSPDARELTFGITTSDWSEFFLYSAKLEDERWTEPVVAPFLGGDSSALTSCLSFDRRRAFFTSSRPSYPRDTPSS